MPLYNFQLYGKKIIGFETTIITHMEQKRQKLLLLNLRGE